MQPSQTPVPPPAQLARGTGAPALGETIVGSAIWILCLQHAVWPVPGLRDLAIVLLGVYLLVSIAQVQLRVWRIVLACAVVVGLAMATGSPLGAIRDGLDMALVFMGFMPAIALIGWALGRSAVLEQVNRRMTALPARERTASLLVTAHVVGSMMAMGTVALLALPFRQVEDDTLREAAGLSALRGMGLSVFWTPFTIGMGFAVSHLPMVPVWQVMLCGMTIAMIGMAISLRRIPPRAILASLALVRRLCLPIGTAAGLLVLANSLTGISGLDIIMVATPVLVLGYAALAGGGSLAVADAASDPRSAFLVLFQDLGSLGNEMMLYSASLIMGVSLAANPLFLQIIGSLDLASLPLPVAFYMMVLLSLLGALLGLHGTLICSVLIAVATGLGDQFTPLTVFMLVLYGWFCGALLSVSSISLIIAQRGFRASLGAFLYGPNLRFAFALGTVLTAIFTLLHACNLV